MTEHLNIKVFQDGDQWCALQGENLQEGIGGFGDTIANALHQLAFKLEYQKLEKEPVAKVSLDEELLAKVTRYLSLKPIVKEHDGLYDLIKASVEGEPIIELGGYDITGQYITRKAYTAEVKQSTYWKMNIKPNPQRVGTAKR